MVLTTTAKILTFEIRGSKIISKYPQHYWYQVEIEYMKQGVGIDQWVGPLLVYCKVME